MRISEVNQGMPRGKIEPNSEKRRQEILLAALDCFITKSYSETTMSDIQKRSGASMGSIYHHFDNKEKLAAELYLEGITRLHNALRQVLETIKEAEVGIKGLVKAYIDWVKTNSDLGHYMFQGMSAQYLEFAGE